MEINDLEIKNNIKKILKKIKGEYFEYERELVTLHYISSFEILELINELEVLFDIKIMIEEISPECFDSVQNIYGLVKKHM